MTTPMTSVVPQVIDYLVAAAQASALLGASPTAPVVVTDGPPLTTDTFAGQLHLWVGADPAGSDEAALATQAWAHLDRGRTRDEDGEVVLTADAWSGTTNMSAVRGQCAAIVAGVELLLRGFPQDGGPGDLTMGGIAYWSEVGGPFTWSQRQTQQGAGCSVSFRVSYRARIFTAGGS